MNTPTPETSIAWDAVSRRSIPSGMYDSSVGGMAYACAMLDHSKKIERERDEARAIIADALKALPVSLPVGMLPADVENLRHSNGVLADSLYKAERELASALSDVNLLKAHITELQSTKSLLELQ